MPHLFATADIVLEKQETNCKTQPLTPIRKALSPITDVLDQESLNYSTPLNKFSECSSNLKVSLSPLVEIMLIL